MGEDNALMGDGGLVSWVEGSSVKLGLGSSGIVRGPKQVQRFPMLWSAMPSWRECLGHRQPAFWLDDLRRCC